MKYDYPDFVTSTRYGEAGGLGGVNCYHDFHPFIPGISERTYTDEELEEMNRRENIPVEYNGKQYTGYEALQRQRRLETAIRAKRQEVKLLQLGGAAEEDILYAKCRYQGICQEYSMFSKAMGIPMQKERIGVGNAGDKLKKAVDIRADSGIIKEQEMMPRKSKTGNFAVDWEKVQSEEYSSKFRKLSNDEKISSAIETRAKWALNNRDGKTTEELYAISLKDGREVSRIADQHNDSAVMRTPKFTREIKEADEAGEEILLLHNHPKGLPPSISDINALLPNKRISGITIGHNGSIYRYTRPNEEISERDWSISLRHYKDYSEVTSMEKALKDLSREFGFEFEIL